MNTRTETNHSPQAIKQAKRFYKWLWWSPILLIPTTAVLLLLNYWIFNYEEGKIFAFAALWHLAFLLLPAIGHKVTYVRWHARQALLIALFFTLLQIIFYQNVFVEGFIIWAYIIHFFITLWGFKQIERGEIWLANWLGINIQKDTEKGIEKIDNSLDPLENIELIKLEYLINETVKKPIYGAYDTGFSSTLNEFIKLYESSFVAVYFDDRGDWDLKDRSEELLASPELILTLDGSFLLAD